MSLTLDFEWVASITHSTGPLYRSLGNCVESFEKIFEWTLNRHRQTTQAVLAGNLAFQIDVILCAGLQHRSVKTMALFKPKVYIHFYIHTSE